jgi:hypothetical protein
VWFVDALKTSIINSLAHTGLHNRNCEGDDTELLDSVRTFLKESEASPQNPSTGHGMDTLCDGPSRCHIAEKVKQEANCNMSVVSLPGICFLLPGVMSSPCDVVKQYLHTVRRVERGETFCNSS